MEGIGCRGRVDYVGEKLDDVVGEVIVGIQKKPSTKDSRKHGAQVD